MKLKDCLEFVKGLQSPIVSVLHSEWKQTTENGIVRDEYKNKDVLNYRSDEYMDKEVATFRVSSGADGLRPTVNITLPWEEQLIPDYWTVDEKKVDEDEEEVA